MVTNDAKLSFLADYVHLPSTSIKYNTSRHFKKKFHSLFCISILSNFTEFHFSYIFNLYENVTTKRPFTNE